MKMQTARLTTAAAILALLSTLILTGCVEPPYRPTSASMGREEARQIVLGSISSAKWRNSQGEIRINDIKINNDGLAFLYQVHEIKVKHGLLRQDEYVWTPPVVSTCYFAGLNPDEQFSRVRICDFTASYTNPDDARQLANALYSLRSR